MKKNKPTKQDFANKIHMMMASTFDLWWPENDDATATSLVGSANLAAQGIARKLAGATDGFPRLDSKIWQRIVKDATRKAFMEVDDGGPMVQLGKNPGFARAVAECTAHLVAPAGSDWAISVQKKKTQSLRATLRTHGIPDSEIKRLLKHLSKPKLRNDDSTLAA
jgi:hypothetical protein